MKKEDKLPVALAALREIAKQKTKVVRVDLAEFGNSYEVMIAKCALSRMSKKSVEAK